MALAFTAAAAHNDEVNFGTGISAIDVDTCTVAIWVRLDGSITDDIYLFGNRVSPNPTIELSIQNDGATDTNVLQFGRLYSGGPVQTQSNDNAISVDTDHFIVIRDNGSGSTVQMFVGSKTTGVTEVSGYKAQPSSSGTVTAQSTKPFCLGNRGASEAEGNPGTYAFCAVFDTALTDTQIGALQFNPFFGSPDLRAFPGAQGTSTVYDFSGNGNDGTITGTVSISDDPFELFPVGATWAHTRTVVTPPAPSTAEKRPRMAARMRM